MRVFVLGAGASVHAGYPTGGKLGEALLAWAEKDKTRGRQFLDDLLELHKEFGNLADFERALTTLHEDLEAKRRNTIPDLGRAISEFFDSIRNPPARLYDRFARERVGRGDVIVTFNYDMAVERSLKAAGLWEIVDGYGATFALKPREMPFSPVKVLKLHGSTNWWGLIFGGQTFGTSVVQDSVGQRPVLFFEADYEFLGDTGVCDPKAPPRAALRDCLILPVLRKQFFVETTFGKEWKPFWDSLWLEAEHALRTADEVVLVGFSLLPADERARDLLLCRSNRYASLTVCSQSQSQRIADEFRSHGFKSVYVPPEPTFEAWLNAPEQVAPPYELSNEEWEREFEDLANSFPQTPVLSDEAISRESLYGPDE
jgi:hypothetical protein